MYRGSRHRRFWSPLLTLVGVMGLCGYGVIAAMSADPLWFLGWTAMPDPERIVISAAGEEIVLTDDASAYGPMVDATRRSLSAFSNLAPLSAGLGEEALEAHRRRGVVIELTFREPVDFHLPFNDGRPTALLILAEGGDGERGYVFRGRGGAWWSGQMCMRDSQPLLNTLARLGYTQQEIRGQGDLDD